MIKRPINIVILLAMTCAGCNFSSTVPNDARYYDGIKPGRTFRLRLDAILLEGADIPGDNRVHYTISRTGFPGGRWIGTIGKGTEVRIVRLVGVYYSPLPTYLHERIDPIAELLDGEHRGLVADISPICGHDAKMIDGHQVEPATLTYSILLPTVPEPGDPRIGWPEKNGEPNDDAIRSTEAIFR